MRAAVRPAFLPGVSGGIEPYVQGLARGLSALTGEDRFDFVGTLAQQASLQPFIGGPARWITLPANQRRSELALRRLARKAGLGRLRARSLVGQSSRSVHPPAAPPLVEESAYDVVHFAAQAGESTRHPFIYQPWDLQHLHYPEFFSKDVLAQRSVIWGPCSRRARYVLVASDFVRRDVIDAFGVDPARVGVVPPGAPLAPALSRAETSQPFALFPARTWLHKNHSRLIDAIGILRARGTDVTLVCPGQPNERDNEMRRHAQTRQVADLVQFPGFVSAPELADLFSAARCLVFPSMFEGFGFPVLEAFVAGLPVACSNTTSLPELAGDAAVLFDPTDAEAIAGAIERIWTDDGLRAQLVARGRTRAAAYSWDHLARSCRALYRAAAGLALDPTDASLLAAAGVSS